MYKFADNNKQQQDKTKPFSLPIKKPLESKSQDSTTAKTTDKDDFEPIVEHLNDDFYLRKMKKQTSPVWKHPILKISNNNNKLVEYIKAKQQENLFLQCKNCHRTSQLKCNLFCCESGDVIEFENNQQKEQDEEEGEEESTTTANSGGGEDEYNDNDSSILSTQPTISIVTQPLVIVAIEIGECQSGFAFAHTFNGITKDSTDNVSSTNNIEHYKTSTIILLTPSGRFHSFGEDARDYYLDLDKDVANKWLFFDSLKINLKNTVSLKDHRIVALNGSRFSTLKLFSLILAHFKQLSLSEINKNWPNSTNHRLILNENIKWILTVSASFQEEQVEFLMREAAYEANLVTRNSNSNDLFIVTKPEVASIQVQSLLINDDAITSNTSSNQLLAKTVNSASSSQFFIIIDCDGNSIDLFVYETLKNYKLNCNHIKEFYKSSSSSLSSLSTGNF
jgi:hypothetical protein